MKTCPVFAFAAIIAQAGGQDVACPREGCAWWDEAAEKCSVVLRLNTPMDYDEPKDDEPEGDPFKTL